MTRGGNLLCHLSNMWSVFHSLLRQPISGLCFLFSMWVKMKTVYHFVSLVKWRERFGVQIMPETELKVTTYFTALDTLIHISWQPQMPGASDIQKYRSRKLRLPKPHFFWGGRDCFQFYYLFLNFYLLNLLGWHWLIKLYKFQVYNSINASSKCYIVCSQLFYMYWLI